jgi:subtilase family serine protease
MEKAVGVPRSVSEAPLRDRRRVPSGRIAGPAPAEAPALAPGERTGAPTASAPKHKQGTGGRTEAQGYRNIPPVPGISNTPSTREPYWACPHSLCAAIIDPKPTRVDGHWKLPRATRALEGTGELGGYNPQDLESAYNVFAAQGGKENKAAEEKQTVALIDQGPYPNAEKDLNQYRKTYHLEECTKANGCFKHINQAGEEGNYSPAEEFGVETPLDLDMATAGCPNCHILLVSANSANMLDLGASAKKAAELGANEISNSYGAAEQAFNSEALNSDYHFKEGVMDFASSGDGGYLGYLYGQESLWYPAAQTYEISVGGTALYRANNARGWTESNWWAAGGGCSRYRVPQSRRQRRHRGGRARNPGVRVLQRQVGTLGRHQRRLAAGRGHRGARERVCALVARRRCLLLRPGGV